jgi:hypothetical protein
MLTNDNVGGVIQMPGKLRPASAGITGTTIIVINATSGGRQLGNYVTHHNTQITGTERVSGRYVFVFFDCKYLTAHLKQDMLTAIRLITSLG